MKKVLFAVALAAVCVFTGCSTSGSSWQPSDIQYTYQIFYGEGAQQKDGLCGVSTITDKNGKGFTDLSEDVMGFINAIGTVKKQLGNTDFSDDQIAAMFTAVINGWNGKVNAKVELKKSAKLNPEGTNPDDFPNSVRKWTLKTN